MSSLLFSLTVGIGFIVAANLGLARFTRLDSARAAALTALAALGIYLPSAIIFWPGADVLTLHLAVYLLAALACGLLLGNRERTRLAGQRRKLHWGPAAIIGFFVVLAVVDATLIVLSEQGLSPRLAKRLLPEARRETEVFSIFPGVISHDFQQKETRFNAYLHQRERQAARGWQIRKGWLSTPTAGKTAVFKVMAQTREGDPVPGATVTGRFLRPSDSRLDTEFAMHEVAPGVYETILKLPEPGRWDLVLNVRKGDALHEVRARTSVRAL